MLVSAEPMVCQPAKKSQVALAYQALARLCGLFYFQTHPKILIDRGGQGFSLSSVGRYSVRFFRLPLLDETYFSQGCIGFVAFKRGNRNLLPSTYQGHTVRRVLELKCGT
jgi:hypothetical protein